MESEATTKDTFMEGVETYTSFKIATFLATYWFPVLVPIGVVGNTLSFLVMIKPNNRKCQLAFTWQLLVSMIIL